MLQNASYMFFFKKKETKQSKTTTKKKKKVSMYRSGTRDIGRQESRRLWRAMHYALRHATKLLRPLVKLIIFIIFVPTR